MKTVGGMRRPMLRGTDRLGSAFTFAAAAYNLVRLPKLLAAWGQRAVASELRFEEPQQQMLKIVRNLDNPLKSGLLQQPARMPIHAAPSRQGIASVTGSDFLLSLRPPKAPIHPPVARPQLARCTAARVHKAHIGPGTDRQRDPSRFHHVRSVDSELSDSVCEQSEVTKAREVLKAGQDACSAILDICAQPKGSTTYLKEVPR